MNFDEIFFMEQNEIEFETQLFTFYFFSGNIRCNWLCQTFTLSCLHCTVLFFLSQRIEPNQIRV